MGDHTLCSPEVQEEEEDEELLLFTLALNKGRKRCWIHDINLSRPNFGEYHHLVQEMQDDEGKFKQYFRLSPAQLTEVLSLIEEDIYKHDTNYRKSITAGERLAVTLR